ncbi:MAG: hypothetical protein WAO95_06415 [Burkholderiales bacterium]
MLRAALVFAIALLPLAALAQSYRCAAKDGKKYYGSTVPPQCLGQPVEQLDGRGVVVRRFDAQASADERAKKEADEVESKKRAALAKEQGRRDSALLASYTGEKDIEVARARALESPQQAVKDAENRIAALNKQCGAPKEDTKAVDSELKAQQEVLAARRKEIDAINVRYDEDKKRYIAIKQGK